MHIALPTLITFLVYLAAMIAVGLVTYRMTSNLSDYVLGGRSLGPGVAALSAGASDMSGWLLLGLPGTIYGARMSKAWIAIGLTIGAYLNWQFVARRLRIYTEVANDSITVPDFLHNRFEDRTRLLRVFSALVILVFFAFYTSAGMVAGAKLFEASFGLNYYAALWGGGAVIVSYTFLGGFLAVAWTDFVQGIIMFFALLIAPALAVTTQGGWSETVAQVGAVDLSYNNIMSGMSLFSIISLAAWGLGYFGQPHIIVRFMAMRDHRDVPTARLIGIAWMVISLFGAIAVGYTGIAYFADNPLPDHEKVFILMATALANPWIAGFLLAAILAAIMSTISSQLLVSSSALAEDIYKAFVRPRASETELVWVGRIGVLVIAVIALLIAGNPDSKVLDLVAYAWSGFGAAFGPVVLFSLFWRRTTQWGALAGMLVGAITVIVWKQLSGGIFQMYEIVPGFILCSLVLVLVSLVTRPSESVLASFDAAAARWRRVTN
nr:sodium/proline symporter PutP [Salinisphaera sp. Q1T1-3]